MPSASPLSLRALSRLFSRLYVRLSSSHGPSLLAPTSLTRPQLVMAAPDDMPTAQPGSDRDGLSLADDILRHTQYLYALVLLIAFVSCAAWYSVVNAKKEEDLVQPKVKGPGGKPLPLTKKKRTLADGSRKIGPGFGRTAKNVFRYLAAIVFLTYVASASLMFNHAFWHEDPYRWSKEGLPWAGEWSVVRETPAR